MLTQRLGSETQKNPQFIDRLISAMSRHPGSCDEVWLASDYGFPPLEKHRRSADTLVTVAQLMRKNGVRVSLQISNTIGHGQYMSSTDCSGLVYDGSPVEKLVGHDGTTADYCFCWNGKHFREYTLAAVRMYAQTKPYCVWVDDDFRASNHNPVNYGCFCDECMERFNKKYGSSFTRESLVNEISFGDIEWRKKFVEFERENLGELMYLITKAVMEVSPESKMGFQCYASGGLTGNDLHFIFDAMKKGSGKNPCARPGGGAYSDADPNVFLSKAFSISYQNYLLPEYVEDIRPEIENLPDVIFGKTIAGTCFETSLYFAGGATSMSYAMLMNDYEQMSWHEKMLASFACHRDYWEKLSQINRCTTQAGLHVAVSQYEWLSKCTDTDDPLYWRSVKTNVYSKLLRAALPLAFGKSRSPVYLIHPHYAAALSSDEIEHMLRCPVITDGESLEILELRGFGFSAKAKAKDTSRLYETYTDHEINSGFSGKRWSQSFYITSGHELFGCESDDIFGIYNTRSVGVEKSDGCYPYGIANAVVTTQYGARWAVFGHSPWNEIISSDKQRQLLNAADYISEKRLPARLETPWQAQLLPRENDKGETVCVSVVNCTLGTSDELQLRIRRPSSESFVFMCGGSGEISLKAEHTDDGCLVTIPKIAPWSVCTVFCV